jgi:hypothetical protein
MQRMHRKQRLAVSRHQAILVWVALTGAKLCLTCGRYRVSGRIVDNALFCDNCDQKLHFPWPANAEVWHA